MTEQRSQRSQNRRQALLTAAAEVFFEQGYAAASVDSIIARAGGSKRNIYTEFGNKEGLFSAIVSANADDVLSALVIDKSESQSLHDVLTAFGHHLMDTYMSPMVIGTYRIVVTEALRFPNLARTFYENGPRRAAARLAEVLERAQARGDIRTSSCSLAAEHFIGMIRDNRHLEVVLGLRPPPSLDETRLAVASAVQTFLNGICAR